MLSGRTNRTLCLLLLAGAAVIGPWSAPRAAASEVRAQKREEAAQRHADKHGESFRLRARSAMEHALGAPIREKQDAINAAYLKAGWDWGAETPDTLDNRAFRQAWAWGFRIEDFAANRHDQFSINDLTEAPLKPDEEAVPALYSIQEELSRAKAREAARAGAPDEQARIADMEQRVARAQLALDDLNQEIERLDDAKASGELPSKTELRSTVDELSRSLDDSADSLTTMNEDLKALSVKLTDE
jgi:hypothetical protein